MIRKIVKYLREDYNRRTFIFAGVSIIVNLSFAIYNGVLGIAYDSIWHISIFGYYLLLMLLKGLLVSGEIYSKKINDNKIYITIYVSFIILVITTIAMIAPAIVLIQNKREFDWGLIPAIVMAGYTTYCITLAIINMTKVKTNDNIIVKQIRLINMIAAIMSILVLQNTMITANGGYNGEMVLLSIYTSIAIILSIVIIVVCSLVKTIKNRKNEDTLEE